MRILFFGRLAERFGAMLDHEAPDDCTIADLRRALALNEPGIRACVGNSLVNDDLVLDAADEVEFWPPVSGG